jgi:hypothetical protein
MGAGIPGREENECSVWRCERTCRVWETARSKLRPGPVEETGQIRGHQLPEMGIQAKEAGLALRTTESH